jgi:phosphoribosyl 1,2-cyclic phosphodiesterase
MRLTVWGTRGSIPAPGPETVRYGGNTSCVEVRDARGTVLVLDAGSGIRRLGFALAGGSERVDLLLTHLHMDHIIGLGFFAPLRQPGRPVHIWGPASATMSLGQRLTRYLSPPLFPVRLRDLPCALELHEVPCGDFAVGDFTISAALVCHPDPAVGYRITTPGATLTYLPDHEPALGEPRSNLDGAWTSGYALAAGADLLIHDAQYTEEEYAPRTGWGHSTLAQAVAFGSLAGVRGLMPFHHDPTHSDEELDRMFAAAMAALRPAFPVTPAVEGASFTLGA